MAQRRTFPGGLRAQLLLALTALLVGAFGLAGLAVENVVSRRLQEAEMESASRVAELALVAPLADQPSLESFARAGGVEYVRVEERGATRAVGPPPGAVDWRGEADGYALTRVGEDRWFLARRTSPHRERVVVVGASLEEVHARLRETRAFLWPLFILDGVFILVFGYAFFTFFILRPIRAVGVATERAAQGDLASPITVAPANEIGRVARSFNRMLERLEDNRVELEARLEALQWANAEVTRAQDSLVRSEKLASVGQLAAGVAHEVGNPLAAISGYNELLREGDLDPDDVDDLLARTGVQLERIRGIIRNLLDFSREESGEPEPTDLGACVEETVSLVSALPKARAARFLVDERLRSGAAPAVDAVPARVVQVLVNLALNAIDAMAGVDAPQVAFRLESDPTQVLLHVDDVGPGIDPARLNRIFDPFYTTKDPGEGTGLGLAISSRIMASFGGELRVDSEPGRTRFTLVFPRAASALSSGGD